MPTCPVPVARIPRNQPAMPPQEAVRKSRRQLERRYSDIVFFNEPAEGGHFFALEQPDTFVADIRATFALLT